jgi:K+-sensing histidine kinase KdpD
VNNDLTTKTVAEISTESGIPESVIAHAIQTNELNATESPAGAKVANNNTLKNWIKDNHPAQIFAALSGNPTVPTDQRMQLLSKLPYLARKLVNADYAALTLGNQNGRIESMIVSGMSDAQTMPIGHPPVGRGVLGNLDHSDAPIRIGDIANHQRSTGFPDGHPDMKAMIGVGVSSDVNEDETIRIYVTRISGQSSFTAEDQEVIESLAAFAKQALDFDTVRKAETDLRIRAEEAEKAKSDFMSMINHDLKNPIAAMQAAIETASIDPNYTEENLIDDIKSSLETQSALIGSLLDMARLGKTAQDFELEDYYPIDLINGAIRRSTTSPRGQNRTIESNVPTNLPALRCDPVHMGRVFDNLLTNAIKYSTETISVTALTDALKSNVIFQVVDQGPGIPKSDQDRIFEPFERITSNSKTIEGLGLGLAICKTIVEAHNGTITYRRIHPRTGGSIFEIILPTAN